MQKKNEYGIELAAKDLADIVDLVRSNREKITEQFISRFHPGVREELARIWRKLKNR